MKFVFPILLATVLGELTIRSTSISSINTCTSSAPVLPSANLGYYGNNSIEAIPSTSSKSKSIKYEYETDYNTDIIQASKTICDNQNNCYVTTDLESLTTFTTTVNGILTVITTHVPVETPEPLSQTQAPVPVTHAPNTEEDVSTTTLLITSCFDNNCVSLTQVTGYKVYTSDETIYTTYCPLSTVTEIPKSIEDLNSVQGQESIHVEKPATESQPQEASKVTQAPISSVGTVTLYGTTVLTITSCSNEKCTQIAKPTGVQIISNEKTVYTTYCPLSEETTKSSTTSVPAPAPKPVESEMVSSPVTINVITDNIVTETPSIQEQVSKSTIDSQSTNVSAVSAPSISTTYEGIAAVTSVSGILISLIFFMI
ncbi:unnamed protein product [Candida verbasci]|uniref:Uncharacterized protein n=1 Tax=Candida verbasci TaxID=1227364 RepID=A0A9W4TX79_9ASCO|nr:unnamed protein product [Candida verbasci]